MFLFINPGKTLAPWMLALEEESHRPYIKKVIKKILQNRDPWQSSLDAIISLLLNVSYLILSSGYFRNLKKKSAGIKKKELYYTHFLLCVILWMYNTLNEQLAVISLGFFFHRVDWDFAFSALHMFGYRNKLIHIVEVRYTNMQYKIKRNGLLI